jgi:hypothetical protein
MKMTTDKLLKKLEKQDDKYILCAARLEAAENNLIRIKDDLSKPNDRLFFDKSKGVTETMKEETRELVDKHKRFKEAVEEENTARTAFLKTLIKIRG